MLVRSVASRAVAVLAVVFILLGSDFSYLAAWFLPHAAVDWDYLLWPTNFLSPTMQVLHFATWSPSLPVFFTALVAIVRGLQTRSRGWLVLSAMLIGVLFQFKPFCYVVLMGALCASALFSGGDWTARRRYIETVALTIVFTLPFLWSAATLDPADRRTRLVIDFFLLPKRMLIKIDLTDAFARAASRLAVWPPLETPIFLLMATVVFFLVGIGVRWLGIPAVWRAIRRPRGPDAASWRLLGWGVISGIAIPFVLTTSPYVDTLQFYLTGLYLLWVFTAATLVAWARTRPLAGGIAMAVAFVLSLPSSLHYLDRKLTDRQREPRVGLTRSEVAIAESAAGDGSRENRHPSRSPADAVAHRHRVGAADRARLGRPLLGGRWGRAPSRSQPLLLVGGRGSGGRGADSQQVSDHACDRPVAGRSCSSRHPGRAEAHPQVSRTSLSTRCPRAPDLRPRSVPAWSGSCSLQTA